MFRKSEIGSGSLSRRNLLMKLGLAAGAAYAAPTLLQLDQARASGSAYGGGSHSSGQRPTWGTRRGSYSGRRWSRWDRRSGSHDGGRRPTWGTRRGSSS